MLDIIATLKDEGQLSESLIAALGGKEGEGTVATDEQFKLPDLVSSELSRERQAALEEECELLKPLPKPAIKPRSYSHTHYDKEKIKMEQQYSGNNRDRKQRSYCNKISSLS